MPRIRRLLLLTLAGALLTACGDTPFASTSMPTDIPPASGEVTGVATVLEADDGPRLCLGAVTLSLPPQCGGPAIEGFDWSQVEHEEKAGVRWTAWVRVTGTWDGTTLTLTRTPLTEVEDPPTPTFETLCPEPEGGWQVHDDTMVGAADLDAASQLLDARSDVIAVHITHFGEIGERLRTDPAGVDEDGIDTVPSTIFNVVATDPEAVESALGEVWGGAVCVIVGTGMTAEERTRINSEIWQSPPPGALSGGPTQDVVEIQVIHDDGSIQRALDAEHGSGVVVVTSALKPVTTT